MTTAVIKLSKTGVLGILKQLAQSARSRWQLVKPQIGKGEAIRYFSVMSDHQLKDIGIHRSQISLVFEASIDKLQYQDS